MKLKKIILTAILSSLSIVLYEFVNIPVPPTDQPIFKISLGIIPIFFIAYFCGTLYSSVASGIIDFLGWYIFSSSKYAFNIGFTIGAIIGGFLIGIALNNKRIKNVRLLNIILLISLFVLDTSIFVIYAIKDNLTFSIFKNNVSWYIYFIVLFVLIVIDIVFILLSNKFKIDQKINTSFIMYQFIVSILITPISQSLLSSVSLGVYLMAKLITGPIILIIYVVISSLLLKVIPNKYKTNYII